MKFWKMNGAGNDFLIIDNTVENIPPDKLPEIVSTLCERHLGIGADGFMVVENASGKYDADYRMVFYNSDGSIGEMCGNGARCICRYGYENGMAGETQRVETDAGLVTGVRISGSEYEVRLNDPCNFRFDEVIEFEREEFKCSYVELGNPGVPHAVVNIEGLRDYDDEKLLRIGRFLRYHETFPKGANINFYEKIGEDRFYEKTYERGVEDFTYACGTGTGSLVSILTLKGEASGKAVKVEMRGGELEINLDVSYGNIKNIFLKGPTNIVCKGEVTDENIII